MHEFTRRECNNIREAAPLVSSVRDPGRSSFSFIIRPNQSLSWRGLVVFYVGIVTISMTIALAFYATGLWMVLPFSGLEMLALGAALYVCAWRGEMREVISIDEQRVAVEKGRRRLAERYEFQRGWAQVVLQGSRTSWYPTRLLIRSHGREVEVGAFLNEQERQGLARALGQALKLN